MKKILASLVAICAFTACDSIDKAYQGTFASSSMNLSIASNGALVQTANGQIQLNGFYSGFENAQKALANAQSGIYALPTIASVNGIPFNNPFYLRNPEKMEAATGIAYRPGSQDIFLVFNVRDVERTNTGFGTLTEMNADMIYLNATQTSSKVSSLNATYSFDAHLITNSIDIAKLHQLGFKANSKENLVFNRTN